MGDQKYLDDWPTRFSASTCSSIRAAGSHPGTSRRTRSASGTVRPRWTAGRSSSTTTTRFASTGRQRPPDSRRPPRSCRAALRTRRSTGGRTIRSRPRNDGSSGGHTCDALEEAHRLIGSRPGVGTYPARELAAKGARLGRRVAGRVRRTLDPARFLPGARSRYRDSWRSADVAQQMLALTEDAARPTRRQSRPTSRSDELVTPLVEGQELPRPGSDPRHRCGRGRIWRAARALVARPVRLRRSGLLGGDPRGRARALARASVRAARRARARCAGRL